MIDTQRLGALLRAWIRDDALLERTRVPGTLAVRAVAPIGPGTPDQDAPAGRSPDANGRVTSSADAARGPAVAGSVPATAGTGAASTALQLSAAAQELLEALRDVAPLAHADGTAGGVAADESPGRAAANASAAPVRPLVAVPPHSEYATDRLALELKDAVEYSGMFYESHLAQWADDRRPREMLAREPQASWPGIDASHPQPASPQASHAAPEFARALLREQLAVLDSGRFSWQGTLWPGQDARLSIEEDPSQPREVRPRTVASRWRMRLSLTFPHLGTVEAELSLAGETLDVTLRCDDAGTTSRVHNAVPALRTAIAGRELEVGSVEVAHVA